MKQLLLLIINVFFITILSAQPNFSNAYRVAADSSFYTTFGSLVTTDSAYYVSGVTNDTLHGYNINRGMLMKIDTSGNKVWAKVYGDTTKTMETLYGTMFTTNQGYLANAGRNPYDGTGFLLITDSEGNIIINKNYDSQTPNIRIGLRGVIQDSLDNFYLLGNYYYQYHSESVIIKTDSLGNELWRQVYTAPTYNSVFANDMIMTNNNRFIIACSKYLNDYHQFSYKEGVWIFEIDSTGNLLNEYHTPINNRWLSVYSMTETEDKGIIFCHYEGTRVTGTNPNIPAYRYEGYISKLDSNLQLVWEKRYGSKFSQFAHIKEKENGHILVTGSVASDLSLDSVDLTGWLMELDENGDSLWQREYNIFAGTKQIHALLEFDILTDGRLVIAGYVQNMMANAGNAVFYWGWLIRTDSFGCIVPGCQLLDNTENVAVVFDNDVTVFPNPASEVVHFRFDKAVDKKVEIRVYSGLGQLVGQITEVSGQANMNNSTETQMNVSDWHSGMYFYGIYVEGKLVKQGQILVEK
jgi:hypothetical protein